MAKIDQPVIGSEAEVKPNDTQVGEMPIGATQEEMDLIPLKQFIGQKEYDYEDEKWLGGIVSWAKERGIKSREDLFTEIKKVELKIGSPSLGESRLKRLHGYFELDRKLGSILKELEAYEQST
jgi:hypothetical protein